jgi:hypothetical protein
MSGMAAEMAAKRPTLRTPDAALPGSMFACMISSCNRSDAQFWREKLGLAEGPVNPRKLTSSRLVPHASLRVSANPL